MNPKRGLLTIGIALALLAPAGIATATHPETFHITYEIPAVQTGARLEDSSEDILGVTSDGSFDLQGTEFFCPKDHHEDGTFPDWARSGCGYDSVQASVVDDTFGSGVVGATISSDFNDNHITGEEEHGEFVHDFCGSSPVFDIPVMPDAGTGGIAIFLNGAAEQTLNCDPTAAPTATTGGVVNPNGGIFVTFTNAPH